MSSEVQTLVNRNIFMTTGIAVEEIRRGGAYISSALNV